MSEAGTSSRRFETFSFLPPLSEDEVRSQVDHILKENLVPAVEYATDRDSRNVFWGMWRLPLFEASTAAEVMREIEACARAHPGAYVKINGYDPRRQGQVVSFVVRRPG